MAAVTATSSLVVATPVAELRASGSAFRTAGSPVQHVAVTSLGLRSSCGRIAAARASVPDEPQKFSFRREIVASVLAAGAVLSSTGPVWADPVADAKRNVEAAVENVEGSAGKATSQAKGSIDGIFGRNMAPPFKFNGVNRATEALKNTKNAVGNAGAEKATKDVQSVASAPNQSPTSRDAKEAADSVGSAVQEKGSQAVDAGRNFVGQAPDLTDPGSAVKERKDVQSVASAPNQSPTSGDAKEAADSVGSAIQEKGSQVVDAGRNFVGQSPDLTDAGSAVKETGDKAISEVQGLVGQVTTDLIQARDLPSLFPKSGQELKVKVATEAVKAAGNATSN